MQTFNIQDDERVAGNQRRCVIFALLNAYYNATTRMASGRYKAFVPLLNSISTVKSLINVGLINNNHRSIEL